MVIKQIGSNVGMTSTSLWSMLESLFVCVLPLRLHSVLCIFIQLCFSFKEDGRPEEKHKMLLSAKPSPGSDIAVRDAHMLLTMQGMVCHLLTGRASHVLVDLGRHLQGVATQDVVTFNQFEQALRIYHISLTTEVRYLGMNLSLV